MTDRDNNKPASKSQPKNAGLSAATKQNHLAQLLYRRACIEDAVPISEAVAQITFPPDLDPLGRTFVARKARHDEAQPQIFELFKNDDGMDMVRGVSYETVASALCLHLDSYLHIPSCRPYACTFVEAERTVERFANQIAEVTSEEFTKVGFKTYPTDPCYFRLPFDLAEEDPFGLEPFEPMTKAPFWASVLARTSNSDALCHKIYSVFDERANRKQAVYIYGSGDTGKSCISTTLANLLNAREPTGAAIVQNPPPGGKVDAHWSAMLVGKRLLVYNEAPHRFMDTSEFKAITGENIGTIRGLYEGWRTVDLNMQVFFVSNEDPEVSSRPEILRRIIACHVGPITDGLTMSSHQVEAKMREEMPWFLAHCKMVYERTTIGMPVASDTEELMEHVADGMAEDLALFEELFETTDNIEDSLPGHVIREQVASRGRIDDRKFSKLKNIWLREGLLIKSNKKELLESGRRSTVRRYVKIKIRSKVDNAYLTGFNLGRDV